MADFRVVKMLPEFTAIEFFSGIGLARAGMLKAGITTIWANDIDQCKCDLYCAQWGNEDLHCQDVFSIDPKDIPKADIAWASSPCTDLSLAGKRSGLVAGPESSAFFGFVDAIKGMGEDKPKALILENVCGLASSHEGNDYRAVVEEFNALGYSVDSFELNARRWVPQSRPRMFVVGLQHPIDGGEISTSIRPDRLAWIHSDESLATHITPIAEPPKLLSSGLKKTIDSIPYDDPRWWDESRVANFLDSLSPIQKNRCERLVKSKKITARTAFRRTRSGKPVWEMREDDIAGCLRTARGGSSKQAVVVLGRGEIHIRWMTGNEYAKLQGASDFNLEGFSESQIQYAFGDAVAVPVVTWLLKESILPALIQERSMEMNNEIHRGVNKRSA